MIPAFFQITLKAFLLDPDGKLLILRDRASGLGDLPGGRLGRGEIYISWGECLNREIREELGDAIRYELHEEPVFCFPHYMVSDQCEGLGIAFQGKYFDGNISLSDEHDFMEWVNPDEYRFETLFKDHMLDAIYKFLSTRSKILNTETGRQRDSDA